MISLGQWLYNLEERLDWDAEEDDDDPPEVALLGVLALEFES